MHSAICVSWAQRELRAAVATLGALRAPEADRPRAGVTRAGDRRRDRIVVADRSLARAATGAQPGRVDVVLALDRGRADAATGRDVRRHLEGDDDFGQRSEVADVPGDGAARRAHVRGDGRGRVRHARPLRVRAEVVDDDDVRERDGGGRIADRDRVVDRAQVRDRGLAGDLLHVDLRNLALDRVAARLRDRTAVVRGLGGHVERRAAARAVRHHGRNAPLTRLARRDGREVPLHAVVVDLEVGHRRAAVLHRAAELERLAGAQRVGRVDRHLDARRRLGRRSSSRTCCCSRSRSGCW